MHSVITGCLWKMVSAHSSPASAISSQPVGVAVRMTRHRCRQWPQLHCIVENADSQEEKDIPCPAENLYGRSRGEKGFGLIFLVESQGYWFFLNTIPPGLLSPLKYHLLHGTLQWQLCYLLSAALKPVCFMASPACYPWGLSRMSHSCWSVLRRSTEQPQQISA